MNEPIQLNVTHTYRHIESCKKNILLSLNIPKKKSYKRTHFYKLYTVCYIHTDTIITNTTIATTNHRYAL